MITECQRRQKIRKRVGKSGKRSVRIKILFSARVFHQLYSANNDLRLAVGYNEAELHFFLPHTSSYSYFLTNSTRIPNISTKIDSENNSGFAPTKSEKYKKMHFLLNLDIFFLLMLYNCSEINAELNFSFCPKFAHS